MRASATINSRNRRHPIGELFRKHGAAYAFVIPFFVFSIAFSVVPIIRVLVLSFQKGGFLAPPSWVGLKNYTTFFSDSRYLLFFLNNIVFLLLIVPMGQVIAFSLALMLQERTRMSPFFEAVFFLPLLISMVAASVIIAYFFGTHGPINYVLSAMGAGEIDWLGNPFRAKLVIAILELWKGATFYTFIYIAALRAIPDDYFQAAKIEGAGVFTTIRRITIPLVRHAIFFCFTMTSIWTLQIFDSVYVTTQGGPLDATTSVVFSIYRTTFKNNEVGLGSAISIVFLVFILLFTVVQIRLSRTDVEY